MRILAIVLWSLLLVVGIETAEARNFRVNMMPNGSVNRCVNCHVDATGGGARNAFGSAVEALVSPRGQEAFWTPALAAVDSDGDGFTNGEELGDPNGTGTASAGAQVTNPSDANSRPQIQNRMPILAGISAKSVREGETVTFQVEATDEDSDPLTFSARGLPEGASFADRTFRWSPTFDQSGSYSIILAVSDGSEEVTTAVDLTVEDVTRKLTLSSFNPARGTILGVPNDTLRVSVTASNPDGSSVSYTWTVNGIEQIETGDSLLLTVSNGDADDHVSVALQTEETTLTQAWTVGKRLQGDINTDNQASFPDFLALVSVFGKGASDPGFNADADLDGSRRIDFPDFLIFARYFGLSGS